MYSSDFPHLRILKKEKKIWYIEKHFLGVCVSMLKKKKKGGERKEITVVHLWVSRTLLKKKTSGSRPATECKSTKNIHKM